MARDLIFNTQHRNNNTETFQFKMPNNSSSIRIIDLFVAVVIVIVVVVVAVANVVLTRLLFKEGARSNRRKDNLFLLLHNQQNANHILNKY